MLDRDLDAAFAQFREQGFYVAPGLFSILECEKLIEAAQTLPTARDGSLAPTMNVHKLGGVFLGAMCKPSVLNVIDRLVRGRANGLHSQFYFTPPHRAGLGCHQDNYFVEAKSDAFASAWISLVDTDPRNGGLYVYPGSQKEGPLPVKAIESDGGDKRQTVYEETIVPGKYKPIDLTVSRGSVVFIDGYVAHGSHQNYSTGNRYVLLNTYIRAAEAFRRGQTAQREEFELVRG